MWVIALLAAGGICASGQEAPVPQQPAPAYGTDTPLPSVSENPPLSGLDLPNLEPHAAPLSYVQLGAHVIQSVDSNVENAVGGTNLQSITRAEGSAELRRLWSHYDLGVDYLGGVGYYNVKGIGLRQIEELGFYQKVMWKRGQLGIRDAFSYQPEGTFGSAYGAIGATGAGLGTIDRSFGGTALGSLGQVPRIMNLTLVDVVENLTPKSSVTLTGGYGFVHFLQTDPNTGTSFIGNSQISGEIGYNRLLGRHDQAALVYGYQSFHFSTGVSFYSNVIQAIWGHRISGRMDFLVGAGPQFTELNHIYALVPNPTSADQIPPCVVSLQGLDCPTNDLRISAAGRISLRYRFPKSSLDLSYQHYLSSGSGFFAGAETDVAALRFSRPLTRVWSVYSDLGYSRNSRLSALSNTQAAACAADPSTCVGVGANTYQFGFLGLGVHRMFGRTLHGFASYQFNELAFDNSYCGPTGLCNRIASRHVGTIGLDWTPRPMRLD